MLAQFVRSQMNERHTAGWLWHHWMGEEGYVGSDVLKGNCTGFIVAIVAGLCRDEGRERNKYNRGARFA